PFVRGVLEGWGHGLKAVQDVRDRRLQPDAARGHEPDRVFQVCQCADIWKEDAQTPLAEEVDVELQGGAEKRDADEFASGTNRLDRLHQRPGSRETLLRA